MSTPDRKSVLLRAAYDLIARSVDSPVVEEAASILVRYDDANCDGFCLMADIAHELEIDQDADPIPLGEEPT